MPLVPLPAIPVNSLSRDFIVDDVKIEITSLDIASHGGFIIAGCSNGVILFFDITESNPQRNGSFLAQIRPKGMHTSFRLNVKITEDSRVCFAGVLKGSSEMVAIDLSSYNLNWGKYRDFNPKNSKNRGSACASPVITENHSLQQFLFFNYSDAKLRGFGAAACIPVPTTTPILANGEEGTPISMRKYLLACGMGIKNIHVWQVTVNDSLTTEELLTKRRDEWTCIYDVASNGMTITHLGFRNEGKELLTKSAGMNIRVWDLTKYMEEPNTKPQYEDIANTHDVKCILENSTFTYGGTYEFAVVNVDKSVPKEANRDVYELPISVPTSSSNNDDAQSRRRRMMREVQDVVGTQDGLHVLVLCTDGGVMYFKHPDEDEENRVTNSEDSGHIEELMTVQKDPDSNQTWALRRIGSQGLVVLVRAYCKFDKAPRPEPVPAGTIPPMSNSVTQLSKSGVSMISICSLTDLVLKESQSLLTTSKDSLLTWHRTGKFYQEEVPPPPVANPLTLMTPSAVIPSFSSNPSTGDGMSTPRTNSFLDSLNGGIAAEGNEGTRLMGIALESSPSVDGSTDLLPMIKKPVATTSSKGLPPTSKKRKTPSVPDISGLETPQVSVNGGAKKLPKLSHPSKQREEEILSTPSDSARAKRNVETKLFSSAEKSNSIVGDDSVAMEESDNDVHSDAVERLVSFDGSDASPVKSSKSKGDSKVVSAYNMRNHYRDDAAKFSPTPVNLTPVKENSKLGPPPAVPKLIISDQIIPIALEEDSIEEKNYRNSLQAWENKIVFHPYSKECLSSITTLTSAVELDEGSNNWRTFQTQFTGLNERFYKEQRRVFYSLVYEIKQHLLRQYEQHSISGMKEDGWKEKFDSFLRQLRKNLIQDLLSRQKQEWKGFQLQSIIMLDEKNLNLSHDEFLSLQGKINVITPSFAFEQLFALTEEFLTQIRVKGL